MADRLNYQVQYCWKQLTKLYKTFLLASFL